MGNEADGVLFEVPLIASLLHRVYAHHPMQSLCVFCGANVGRDPLFAGAARELGHLLAAKNITLIFGGASVGLMGAVADATLDGGGRAIGVIPLALRDRELAHERLTELHVVETMHERKQRMYDLSDAFVALPGGVGTLDEFFEVLTWNQLGLQTKPCGLLNVQNYFAQLIAFLNHVADQQFLHATNRAHIRAATTPSDLLDQLATAHTNTDWILPHTIETRD